jgi:hypothetical protein
MNENEENLIEDDSPFKRDKIFDNTYEETEVEFGEINFTLDPTVQPKSYEYTIDEKLINEKIVELLQQAKRFDRFQISDENGNFKKMNKSDINEVYSYITSSLPTEPRIEIFSIITSTFDVNADKFYESLSNSFKTELINELKGRGYLKNRNSLF